MHLRDNWWNLKHSQNMLNENVKLTIQTMQSFNVFPMGRWSYLYLYETFIFFYRCGFDQTWNTTKNIFIRSIRAIFFPIAELFRLEADGRVISTRVFRRSTQISLAIILIRLILTINVSITQPRFTDASPLEKRNTYTKLVWKELLENTPIPSTKHPFFVLFWS